MASLLCLCRKFIRYPILNGVLLWLVLLTIFLPGLTPISQAAEPNGVLDPTFASPYTQADFTPERAVRYISLRPDGKILSSLGNIYPRELCDGRGCFPSPYGNYKIALLNENGSPDSSFSGPFFNNQLLMVAFKVQSDGKFLVAFDSNSSSGYIERYNADGTLDTSFSSDGKSPNLDVKTLALQNDGKILVGALSGSGSYEGVDYAGIVRLNPDGSPDATFNSTNLDFRLINNIVVQSDGKLLVTGVTYRPATNYNWTVSRLNSDGSLDNSFSSAVVVPGYDEYTVIRAVALQSDGKLLLALANKLPVNGSYYLSLSRLNNDGSLDSSFNSPLAGPNQYNRIAGLAVQADGKILVAGDFTISGQTGDHALVRLNSDGSLDTTYNDLTFSDEGDFIEALALQPNNKILIGGSFKTSIGYYLARLQNGVKENSNITLTSSANPAVVGHAITFTAQVGPNPPAAAGAVSFNFSLFNGSSFSSGPLPLVNGVATYITQLQEAGNYSVVASYSGDAGHQPGDSASYAQFVVAGCDPLLVTNTQDDGQANTCGSLSYALAQTISGRISFDLPAGANTLSFDGVLSPSLRAGVALDGGANGVILDGKGVSGNGLRLGGNNTLTNLTIRGFNGTQLIAGGKVNRLYRVKIENN